MNTSAHDDIKKSVRGYVLVFVTLLALTVVTVTISYLHLETPVAIAIALFIAALKGSLVASYFMHLISEKRAIFLTLAFTAFFFAALMTLPLLAHSNQVMVHHVP
jgi:cytochrome c oxidase subunit 4